MSDKDLRTRLEESLSTIINSLDESEHELEASNLLYIEDNKDDNIITIKYTKVDRKHAKIDDKGNIIDKSEEFLKILENQLNNVKIDFNKGDHYIDIHLDQPSLEYKLNELALPFLKKEKFEEMNKRQKKLLKDHDGIKTALDELEELLNDNDISTSQEGGVITIGNQPRLIQNVTKLNKLIEQSPSKVIDGSNNKQERLESNVDLRFT